MTDLQQLKDLPLKINDTQPESTNLPKNHHINKPSKIEQSIFTPTEEFEYDQDQEDRILINTWMGKFNSDQTSEEDDFNDQREDDDIKNFLQQQVPGLYRVDQSKSNFNNTKKETHKIPQVVGLNSGSLCREYLGMSRWQKESFFENLNEIYMQRMGCKDRKNQDGEDKSKRGEKKRGIRFSQVINEVVFNKQEQPIMVRNAAQQEGMMVFDDAAYQQSQSSSNSSDMSNSNSNSSSNSADIQKQEFEIISDRNSLSRRQQQGSIIYGQQQQSDCQEIFEESQEEDFYSNENVRRYCTKRVQYIKRLNNNNKDDQDQDELGDIYCEQSSDSNSNFQQQQQSSSSQQQSSSLQRQSSSLQRQSSSLQRQSSSPLQHQEQQGIQKPLLKRVFKKCQKLTNNLHCQQHTSGKQNKSQTIVNNKQQYLTRHQQGKFKRTLNGQFLHSNPQFLHSNPQFLSSNPQFLHSNPQSNHNEQRQRQSKQQKEIEQYQSIRGRKITHINQQLQSSNQQTPLKNNQQKLQLIQLQQNTQSTLTNTENITASNSTQSNQQVLNL